MRKDSGAMLGMDLGFSEVRACILCSAHVLQDCKEEAQEPRRSKGNRQSLVCSAFEWHTILLFGLLSSYYIPSKPQKYILFLPGVTQQPSVSRSEVGIGLLVPSYAD